MLDWTGMRDFLAVAEQVLLRDPRGEVIPGQRHVVVAGVQEGVGIDAVLVEDLLPQVEIQPLVPRFEAASARFDRSRWVVSSSATPDSWASSVLRTAS